MKLYSVAIFLASVTRATSIHESGVRVPAHDLDTNNAVLAFDYELVKACGRECEKSSDCVDACSECINSKCSRPPINFQCSKDYVAKCKEDEDCPDGCSQCVKSWCMPTCGQMCSANFDCAFDSGCTQCVNFTCQNAPERVRCYEDVMGKPGFKEDGDDSFELELDDPRLEDDNSPVPIPDEPLEDMMSPEVMEFATFSKICGFDCPEECGKCVMTNFEDVWY